MPSTTPGKKMICATGYSLSHNVGHTHKLALAITKAYPSEYQAFFHFVSDFRGNDKDPEDDGYLGTVKRCLTDEDQNKFKGHRSAPFCWVMEGTTFKALGGNDRFCEWAAVEFEGKVGNEEVMKLAKSGANPLCDGIIPKIMGWWPVNGVQK
jgi:hypothetical protein